MSSATPENSEWLARKKLIDPQLTAWGWKIISWAKAQQKPLAELSGCAIEEFPTDAGPADYALCVDGSVLAIVEAKKLTLGPQGVLPQAERYSKGVAVSPFNFRGYRVPFLYATNGEVNWFRDVREPLAMSRRIARFHTPDALRESLGRDFAKSCEWFTNTPNDQPKLRPYQKAANAATEQAIADQKRQMLIAMATGTGKTFTLVNQCYRLLKSQQARRILFLVDRRALAAQGVRAFSVFEPEPNLKFDEVYSNKFQKEDFGDEDAFDPKVLPREYLLAPQPKHVYVCTIQRLAI